MPWAADPSFEPTMRFVKEGIASWSNEQAKDFPIVVFHKASRKRGLRSNGTKTCAKTGSSILDNFLHNNGSFFTVAGTEGQPFNT